MLTKDLLRVSRAGGGFRPRFAERSDRPLAARVLGTYQGHVGEERAALEESLTDLEREAEDFKLVRGLAKLVERGATFETRAPVDPLRARRAAFAAAEPDGVVTDDERAAALERAAADLDCTASEAADALHADREDREVLVGLDDGWDPDALLDQYNLSLAQTALFDATELRVRSSDPRALVSAVKRLGLLHEIRSTPEGRVVVLTGPDALFRRTRRYGTRFARLLRAVVAAESWSLEATVDDRGTERTLRLSEDDPVRVPDADPVAEVEYDSDVERDFATRFGSLDLDWELVREPEPLDAGDRVMIPDFAFDYRPASDADGARSSGAGDGAFRVYFEVMGFWTPEYVEKKLAQVEAVDGVELLVAVDESLGVGEQLEARDARVVTYSGRVRVKDVRDALREYEAELVADHAAALPDELRPDEDVTTLAAVAAERGVSEDAVERKSFPDHRRAGRTLLRPSVLEAVDADLEAGMALAEAEDVLSGHGVDDASAVLSELGYRVEWEGLGGGTLREKDGER